MKYMPRQIAFGKLKAMCDAAMRIGDFPCAGEISEPKAPTPILNLL